MTHLMTTRKEYENMLCERVGKRLSEKQMDVMTKQNSPYYVLGSCSGPLPSIGREQMGRGIMGTQRIMGIFFYEQLFHLGEERKGHNSLLALLDVLGEPLETLEEAFASCSATWMDIPRSLTHSVQAKLFSNFGW